jgi:sarcosine oxidase
MGLPDVAVIGAGVFGSWTARWLARRGLRVVLVEAHGPANSRSSSGGESRIVRLGYGGDEIYTRWAARSLGLWHELSETTRPPLLHRTGVLWLSREDDPLCNATLETLHAHRLEHERLDRRELEQRYPQLGLDSVTWGILEPGSGVVMARRAVQTLVTELIRSGVEYRCAAVSAPAAGAGSRLEAVATSAGELRAGAFVFACGPWLPELFPALLAGRIVPTRQVVLFFGPEAGDLWFAPPALPAWVDFGEELYCVPDLEGRGLKIAFDRHGPPFDPSGGSRVIDRREVQAMRAVLQRKLPRLARAPLMEGRVCQYENTSSGDFLIDRHPDLDNVWLVGGGSGHGFKHGPALGEHVAERLLDGSPVDPRFALAGKTTVRARRVY